MSSELLRKGSEYPEITEMEGLELEKVQVLERKLNTL
jgi:hypothetical protein